MTRGVNRRPQDKGAFGTVSKLPSGRWRALYYGPEGKAGRRYKAPTTFTTKTEARKYLATVQAAIITETWLPPSEGTCPAVAKTKALTLAGYANKWLSQRDLKDRTRQHYRKLLDRQILPNLGGLPIGAITADDVRAWYAKTAKDTPTQRAQAYSLLRTIMGTAVTDSKIPANPCTVRGAGTTKRVHKIQPATLPEIDKLAEAMPDKQQALILLASWCALRFGELTELRRRDLDLADGVIRVRRAVVRTDDGFQITTPKSEAGIRDVAIPPHLLPILGRHLADHVGPGKEALLFPADHGGHLAPATLYRRFYSAREAAGRPDLRFHDLRHSGAVLAASTGATLAELMARLGHSTPGAAMRYQHAAQGRDKQIAAALSALASVIEESA